MQFLFEYPSIKINDDLCAGFIEGEATIERDRGTGGDWCIGAISILARDTKARVVELDLPDTGQLYKAIRWWLLEHERAEISEGWERYLAVCREEGVAA